MGFGSNVGDGVANFLAMMSELKARGRPVLRHSSLYRSEPWGGAEGGDFTNAVIEMECVGTPHGLLADLLAVERTLGRVRTGVYSPRTCDLDLLLWGDERVESTDLIVPHPRLAERRFVLIPLAELAAGIVHPLLNHRISELLSECPDPLKVWRLTDPRIERSL